MVRMCVWNEMDPQNVVFSCVKNQVKFHQQISFFGCSRPLLHKCHIHLMSFSSHKFDDNFHWFSVNEINTFDIGKFFFLVRERKFSYTVSLDTKHTAASAVMKTFLLFPSFH